MVVSEWLSHGRSRCVQHLPGQCHYYSFSKLGAAEVGGVLVYKVPFTHPCHLFTVIQVGVRLCSLPGPPAVLPSGNSVSLDCLKQSPLQSLRRQLIYNSLVASCLGGGGGARAPNDGSMLGNVTHFFVSVEWPLARRAGVLAGSEDSASGGH